MTLPEPLLPVPGDLSIILASASPRRKDLLRLILPSFNVVKPQSEGSFKEGESPRLYALRMANEKCWEVFSTHRDSLVIGADTVVVADDAILGKPRNREDAVRMLNTLSSREHQVITGVVVCSPTGEKGFSETSTVRFGSLEQEEIHRYVATGEPMDKAGAYGIQGLGACFVEGVTGSYTNVVGMPVRRLYLCLKEMLSSWHTPA